MTCRDCYHYDVCSKKDGTKMCKNFKDKSLIVELPYKVGEEIYVLNRGNIPQRMIVGEPYISCHCPSESDSSCMALCDDIKTCICADRLKYDGSDIGETVFRTKEEAEAKLERRTKND